MGKEQVWEKASTVHPGWLKLAMRPRVALPLPFSCLSHPSARTTGVLYHTCLHHPQRLPPMLAKQLESPESQRLSSWLLILVDLLCS